jgi:hypothetical protein
MAGFVNNRGQIITASHHITFSRRASVTGYQEREASID